jgi:tetratricopeptide (TPR) repeat protein
LQVTGELDKALDDTQLLTRTYPRDARAINRLGNLYGRVGDFEKALPEYEECIRLSPDGGSGCYTNLANMYVRFDRFDEAKATIEKALARKLVAPLGLHLFLLQLAGITGDRVAEGEQMKWFAGTPNEYQAIRVRAGVAFALGRWRESSRLDRQAMEIAKRRNLSGAGANYQAYHAGGEAFGYCEVARSNARSALQPDQLPSEAFPEAFAFAFCGDAAEARKIADETSKQFPLDTIWNGIYLPTINAATELKRNQPAKAIDLLEAAAPYERTNDAPIYLRGLAYLRMKKGPEAAAEFQKILAYKGANFDMYAMAYVGLARAAAVSGDTAKAKKAYEDFFAFWKDADPDVPLLIGARKEYAALK